jgi:hypothetical protein
MNLTLVSLDIQPGPGNLKFSIPFYCKISGKKRVPRKQEYSKLRVDTITELKNQAISEALQEYPATHIVMVESYYLKQRESVERLIERYREINDPDLILGAPVWVYTVAEWFSKCTFYDTWVAQDLKEMRRSDCPGGLVQVDAVGSAIIFPVWVWLKHRFANPDYPAKIYYNWLCEQSGLPVLIDMDIPFQRCTINGVELEHFPRWYRIAKYYQLKASRWLNL